MSLSLTSKGIIAIVTTTGSIIGIVQATKSSSTEAINTLSNYLETFSEQSQEVTDFAGGGKSNIQPISSVVQNFERTFPISPSQDNIVKKEIKPVLSGGRKRLIRQESQDIFRILEDYSFKIFGPDCFTGTGWILDYKLPQGREKYPTIWYIAINAHVIQNFRFSENPYEQLLPWEDIEGTKAKRREGEHMMPRLKEIPLDFVMPQKCTAPEKYGYLDMSLSKGEEGRMRKSDYGMVARKKIEEPRLFFSAFKFLEQREGLAENHYTDFAVLEIKFTYEEEARRVTNDFASKYTVDSTEAINIFADSLESKYSRDELNSLQENFYLLAYPSNADDKWKYTKNFDNDSAIASHLVGNMNPSRGNSYGGLVYPVDFWNMRWSRRDYERFGHWVLMDHNLLMGGSSGGLFVDKNRNAIAVKTGREGTKSMSIPLRSKQFTFWSAGKEITTPAYDLILGGEGQINSYRDQVKKYILDEGGDTWLNARGWKHIEDRKDYMSVF